MTGKNIKCPLCNRHYATKQALAQHRVASHGNSGGSQPPVGNPARQGAVPKKTKKSNKRGSPGNAPSGQISLAGQTIVMSGTDLIGTVTVGDSDKPGKLLLAWDINPSTLHATRLAQVAGIFSRWRPRSLRLSCHPGAGVFTPGSYAMGWVSDPKYPLGTSEDRLQRVCTLVPNVMASFGTPTILNIPTDPTQRWYLVRPSADGNSDHGLVVAVLAAMVGGRNISLNFRLNWTIEFSSPDVSSSVEEAETYPDPDYLPIFTDSVNGWASAERLTFKHKEGGSVVPWVNARSDMIYQPSKGVKIPYYDSAGKEQECKFFAVIGNEYPSGMACFADEASAKAYLGNHDTSKILKYNKAGEYTTPLLPTLIGKPFESALLEFRRDHVLPVRPAKDSLPPRWLISQVARDRSSIKVGRGTSMPVIDLSLLPGTSASSTINVTGITREGPALSANFVDGVLDDDDPVSQLSNDFEQLDVAEND